MAFNSSRYPATGCTAGRSSPHSPERCNRGSIRHGWDIATTVPWCRALRPRGSEHRPCRLHRGSVKLAGATIRARTKVAVVAAVGGVGVVAWRIDGCGSAGRYRRSADRVTGTTPVTRVVPADTVTNADTGVCGLTIRTSGRTTIHTLGVHVVVRRSIDGSAIILRRGIADDKGHRRSRNRARKGNQPYALHKNLLQVLARMPSEGIPPGSSIVRRYSSAVGWDTNSTLGYACPTPGRPSRPGGISPRAPHRSGLDTLASSGSCHRTKAAAFR